MIKLNAGFGWIDFSEKDRTILKTVLNALKQKGIVDELGIGSIRNSISDLLFPGINTIQTRAKYYILVPQIIQEYQRLLIKKKTKDTLKEFLRKRENEIINTLTKNNPKENGIIGSNIARGNGSKELVQKPSSIYWNGLRKHNIINTKYSISEYLKYFNNYSFSGSEDDDVQVDFFNNFGINLPHLVSIDYENLVINLTKEEAVYLKAQFIDNTHKKEDNLLSVIMKDLKLVEQFIQYTTFKAMANDFENKDLPNETHKNLKLAKDFDFIIHGAHIRYNYLLASKVNAETTNIILKWKKWLAAIQKNKDIATFNMEYLLAIATTTKPQTKQFIQNWYNEILNNQLNTDRIDKLIIDQEYRNKRKLARLSKDKETIEYHNEWIGMGANDESLSYRFYKTQMLVNDIYKGLIL